MKVIQLANTANTITVRYLTDLIGDNKEFTVYQISHLESGAEVLGLGSAATQAGWFDGLEQHNLYEFTQFAIDNDLEMTIFETGQSPELINSADTDFVSFTLPTQTGAATINETNHTISIGIAYGAVDALVASFTLAPGATAAVGETPQVSGVTENDFTSPVVYVVTAEDGSTQNWTVTVTLAENTATEVTAYSMAEQTGAATIDTEAGTVDIEVASGTSLAALVATFTLSYGATAAVGETPQVSGVTENDFTSPVVYVVTAEDGSTQNWTVTVTLAEE